MHMDRKTRLVIVGNGIASLKLLEELDLAAFDITVAGAEPEPAYNRVLLSSLLAGDSAMDDVRFHPRAWYDERCIDLRTGDPATALRPARREVVLQSGARLTYDRLVLATGSDAIRLPIAGAGLRGVTTFRDLADVRALQAVAAGTRAVVIGGGLLGIEAAYGLIRRGLDVTLVHLMPTLMERQLDTTAAAMLRTALEAKGIRVLLSAETEKIEGSAGVMSAVILKDGRRLPAELLVMAVGTRPATQLAATGGLDIGRGIKVDDKLETNWPQVYALGECAEHRGQWYGLVEPAHDQARVLARYLSGRPARYEGSLLSTSLKVSGVPVYSIGDFEGREAETITFHDEGSGCYRKLVIRDGRLAGAVLFGDTSDALWYRELITSGKPIQNVRAWLPFGRAYAEAV